MGNEWPCSRRGGRHLLEKIGDLYFAMLKDLRDDLKSLIAPLRLCRLHEDTEAAASENNLGVDDEVFDASRLVDVFNEGAVGVEADVVEDVVLNKDDERVENLGSRKLRRIGRRRRG